MTPDDLSEDEASILVCFADMLAENGIDGLCAYVSHCGIKLPEGISDGEAILAHYRNPLGYDVDRAAMDLRTWPPVSERLCELQTEEAERRAKSKAKRVRNIRAMNGHATEHPI